MRINSDKLIEESIECFCNYNLNGITGKLTLFLDVGLDTAVQEELINDQKLSKNGIYLVEEIITKFGTQGHRQNISIPYHITQAVN